MDEPDLYELAYLCGGGERVALVALVALCEDGRIQVAHARQRVTVVRPEPRHPVEAALTEAIPGGGLSLWPALARAAVDPAVAEVAAGLRGKVSRFARRRLRARLTADPGAGLRRVAVLGTAGVADERLRRTLRRPDPRLAVRPGPLDRLRGTTPDPADDGRYLRRAAERLERELNRDTDSTGHGSDSGFGDGGGGGDF